VENIKKRCGTRKDEDPKMWRTKDKDGGLLAEILIPQKINVERCGNVNSLS